jgi:FemAB family
MLTTTNSICLLDKKNYDQLQQFFIKDKSFTFAQSYAYLTFNQPNPGLHGFFVKKEGDKITSLCGFVILESKRGKIMQIVHSPIGAVSPIILDQYLVELKNYAKAQKCDFVRINPYITDKNTFDKFRKVLLKHNAQKISYENIPHRTNVLEFGDYTGEFNYKKIYKSGLVDNIRKSLILIKNKDLSIGIGQDLPSECELVYKSLLSKNKYNASLFNSILKEVNHYAKSDQILVATAQYKKQYVGFVVMVKNQKNGVYMANHHACAITDPMIVGKNNFTAIMLHTLIEEGLKQGIRAFDFWGVSDPDKAGHPWAGFSKFKRSFGGLDLSFLEGYDIPLTWKYKITKAYDIVQKIKRRH